MDFIEKTLKVVIVTFLAIMTIVVAFQILSRYIFHNPLGWSEEVTRYLFIYLTFLAASVGVRGHIHIGVDILAERLTGVSKKVLEHIVSFIVIIFLLVLIYFGIKLSVGNWAQKSPSLSLPIGIFYAAIPIGSIFSLLFVLENMFKRNGEEKV
ncbi:TRAP transporter small permease [Virgibacillus sp. W0430]|uniref:TRAP transporter small permease n=1 Tax=Virgibacillus sp. W0430 TaxID=3391580 RepID=UPI003F463F3C